MYIRKGGDWRSIQSIKIRKGNAWRSIVQIKMYVSGAWREVGNFAHPPASPGGGGGGGGGGSGGTGGTGGTGGGSITATAYPDPYIGGAFSSTVTIGPVTITPVGG